MRIRRYASTIRNCVGIPYPTASAAFSTIVPAKKSPAKKAAKKAIAKKPAKKVLAKKAVKKTEIKTIKKSGRLRR